MKVGDVYPTRDGRKAEVTEIDDYLGIATIKIIKPYEGCHVFVNNGRADNNTKYPYDLILPPKTVKAQRVIEYEGTKEWVELQMKRDHNVCGPGREYTTLNGHIIREVSRKFF